MAVFNKPQFNSVWAATGTKIDPGAAKIDIGWVVEIPPHEYANWLENRRDAMLAHLNQAGIPAWDNTAEYQANKSYVQGASTGVVYKCLITNTGVDPELDVQGNWEVAFQRSGEALLKSQNLADVPDKAQARTNLGIATTADYDARYLIKAQNLADVPNKATARGNIDVYSKQEVIDLINTLQPAGEVAPFARNTPPTGWLVCDGAVVSRTTYARLFAAIGTTFGAGNGSTTFGLPDLQGEFIRGWDNGRGVDTGRVFGTSQSSQNLAHTHNGQTSSAGAHSHSFYLSSRTGVNSYPLGATGPLGTYFPTSQEGEHTHNFVTGASGGSEARPRNVALLYCIRT